MVVKRQHFVPQFHQRYFTWNPEADKDRQEVLFAELNDSIWQLKTARINYLLQQHFLYEVQDYSGDNIDENSVELWYKTIEDKVAKWVAKLAKHSSSYQTLNDYYQSIVTGTEFAQMSGMLLMYVATMIIRNPTTYAKLAFDNFPLSHTGKQILRHAQLQGVINAKNMVNSLPNGSEKDMLSDLLVDVDESSTPATQLFLHIMTKFRITIVYADAGHFLLGDNPVLVNKVEFDYFIPMTPKIGLALEPIQINEKKEVTLRANVFKLAHQQSVDQFNKWEVLNSASIVIVKSSKDLAFVSAIDGK